MRRNIFRNHYERANVHDPPGATSNLDLLSCQYANSDRKPKLRGHGTGYVQGVADPISLHATCLLYFALSGVINRSKEIGPQSWAI